jgi:apolipoprotein N-acyltransferase
MLAGLLTLLGFTPFSIPVLPLAGPALLFLTICRAPGPAAFLLGWLYRLAFGLPGMLWVQRLGVA